MAGRKRIATRASSRRGVATEATSGANIYQDMLTEAGVDAHAPDQSERPLKRRRPGVKGDRPHAVSLDLESKPTEAEPSDTVGGAEETAEEDEDIEFEDVALPEPTVQTMELDSEDDEDDNDEDIQFEDVDFSNPLKATEVEPQQSAGLELNLTAQKASTTPTRRAGDRRKPISKEEKERRTEIHKTHLLCLLSHVARRNHWCNDGKVQDFLRAHLTDKMVTYLNPGVDLSQFGRTESIKNGLQQINAMWKTKFEITERGLRRALWAEDLEDLKDVSMLTTVSESS